MSRCMCICNVVQSILIIHVCIYMYVYTLMTASRSLSVKFSSGSRPDSILCVAVYTTEWNRGEARVVPGDVSRSSGLV